MRKPQTTPQHSAPSLPAREIDTILARLAALSSDHFGRESDAVNWGDVGTPTTCLKALREVSDAAFYEGVFAG
jgi:hypothetical protein